MEESNQTRPMDTDVPGLLQKDVIPERGVCEYECLVLLLIFTKYILYPKLAYPERLLTQGYPSASDCLEGLIVPGSSDFLREFLSIQLDL